MLNGFGGLRSLHGKGLLSWRRVLVCLYKRDPIKIPNHDKTSWLHHQHGEKKTPLHFEQKQPATTTVSLIKGLQHWEWPAVSVEGHLKDRSSTVSLSSLKHSGDRCCIASIWQEISPNVCNVWYRRLATYSEPAGPRDVASLEMKEEHIRMGRGS